LKIAANKLEILKTNKELYLSGYYEQKANK